MALLPGIPMLPFLGLAGVTGYLSWKTNKRKQQEASDATLVEEQKMAQAPVAPGNVLQGLPLASELAAPDAQVGSGVGFAQLFAEGTTVELVLARAKHSECLATAMATRPLSGAYQPASNDPQA